MVTRSITAVAKRQSLDVERVVNRSSLISSRLWRVVMAALHNGQDVNTLILENELVDVMAYSYLLRMRLAKRRKTMAKSIELSNVLERDAREMADQFDIDLGNIRKRFAPTAKAAIKRTVKDIRDVMNKALAEATKSGLTNPEKIKYVIARLRKHGIQPRANNYVEALVRTHASIAYGAAHWLSFQNDFDVWGFELVSVGDNRVRPAHVLTDGIRRKKNDPFWNEWWPPNGWNCRCQAVAIYDMSTVQSRIPKGISPDEGFDFNPALLLREDAA